MTEVLTSNQEKELTVAFRTGMINVFECLIHEETFKTNQTLKSDAMTRLLIKGYEIVTENHPKPAVSIQLIVALVTTAINMVIFSWWQDQVKQTTGDPNAVTGVNPVIATGILLLGIIILAGSNVLNDPRNNFMFELQLKRIFSFSNANKHAGQLLRVLSSHEDKDRRVQVYIQTFGGELCRHVNELCSSGKIILKVDWNGLFESEKAVNDKYDDGFHENEDIEYDVVDGAESKYVKRGAVNRAIVRFATSNSVDSNSVEGCQVARMLIFGHSGVGKSTLFYALSKQTELVFDVENESEPRPLFFVFHYSELSEGVESSFQNIFFEMLGDSTSRGAILDYLSLLYDLGGRETLQKIKIVIAIDNIDKHGRTDLIVDALKKMPEMFERYFSCSPEKQLDIQRCFRVMATCTEKKFKALESDFVSWKTHRLADWNSTEVKEAITNYGVQEKVQAYPQLRRVVRRPILIKNLSTIADEDLFGQQSGQTAASLVVESFVESIGLKPFNDVLINLAENIFSGKIQKSAEHDAIARIEKHLRENDKPRFVANLNNYYTFHEDVYYQYFLAKWILGPSSQGANTEYLNTVDFIKANLQNDEDNLREAIRLFFPVDEQKEIIRTAISLANPEAGQALHNYDAIINLAGMLLAELIANIIDLCANSSPQLLKIRLTPQTETESDKEYSDRVEFYIRDIKAILSPGLCNLLFKIQPEDNCFMWQADAAFDVVLKCADHLFSAGCYPGMRLWLEYVESVLLLSTLKFGDESKVRLNSRQSFLLNNNLIVLYKNNDQWIKADDKASANRAIHEKLLHLPENGKHYAAHLINEASALYDVAEKTNRQAATRNSLATLRADNNYITAVAYNNLGIYLVYFDRPHLALSYIDKGIAQLKGEVRRKREELVLAYLMLNHVQVSLYLHEIDSSYKIDAVEDYLESARQAFEDSDFVQGIVYTIASEGLFFLVKSLGDFNNIEYQRRCFNLTVEALIRAKEPSFDEGWPQYGCLANLAILLTVTGPKPIIKVEIEKKQDQSQEEVSVGLKVSSANWTDTTSLQMERKINLETAHVVVTCALELLRSKNSDYVKREDQGVWPIEPSNKYDTECEFIESGVEENQNDDGSPDPEGEGILVMIQAYIEIQQRSIQPGTLQTLINVTTKMNDLGFKWAAFKAAALFEIAKDTAIEGKRIAGEACLSEGQTSEQFQSALTNLDKHNLEWVNDLLDDNADKQSKDAELYRSFFQRAKDTNEILIPINWKFLFLREWLLFDLPPDTSHPTNIDSDQPTVDHSERKKEPSV